MLIGIDYASVDGNMVPRPEKLVQACRDAGSAFSFAILRGAYGASPDPTVQRDWLTLENAGATLGAYLFLRMPHANYNVPPEDQVHVFADNVGTLTGKNFAPALDIEDHGLSGEAEIAWVHRAWVAMRDIYGVPPMIYTSQRVWVEDLHDLPAGEMTDSPLWLAKPWPWAIHTRPQLDGKTLSAGNYDPKVPSPWGAGNWWMHQYQGDAVSVPGFSSTVDLSRFQSMRQGEVGERVSWVQRRLGIIASGRFDGAMSTQVKAFQTAHGLVADAIIGPKTFAAITWCQGVEMPIQPLRAA